MDQELNLKYREVTVTAAELAALVATPKTLVEAPGAGYAHVPVFAVLSQRYGTATYAVPNSDHAAVITGLPALTDAEYQALMEDTNDHTKVIHGEGTSAEIVENAALTLSDPGTGEMTTGDGTLIVRIVYATIQVGTV